jgi:mRNA-degrading endonuclease YafQ of YafQ-DinJ toxin-antitoxin module
MNNTTNITKMVSLAMETPRKQTNKTHVVTGTFRGARDGIIRRFLIEVEDEISSVKKYNTTVSMGSQKKVAGF